MATARKRARTDAVADEFLSHTEASHQQSRPDEAIFFEDRGGISGQSALKRLRKKVSVMAKATP